MRSRVRTIFWMAFLMVFFVWDVLREKKVWMWVGCLASFLEEKEDNLISYRQKSSKEVFLWKNLLINW